MSFETIKIYRQYPVVNGFAQVHNNLESDKSRLTKAAILGDISGSIIERLSGQSGSENGRYGQQEFITLPGVRIDQWQVFAP